MSDLVAFLNARLAEDEAAAKAWAGVQVFAQMNKGGGEPDPRPLREVEAKRKILAAYEATDGGRDEGQGALWALYECLRLLAAVYSDHPGYQQEWA